MSPKFLSLLFPFSLVACQILVIRTFKPKTFFGGVTAMLGGYLLNLVVLGAITTYILPAFQILDLLTTMEGLSC